jgi:hypothetical protein
MTYQETLWKGKHIRLISLLSKRGIVHHHLARFCGMAGVVLGESKNGQLLIEFRTSWRGKKNLTVCVPSGCVREMW